MQRLLATAGLAIASFVASLDGGTRAFMGELIGDEIRLTVEGARSPGTLRDPRSGH